MISVKMISDISRIKPTINNVLTSIREELTENEFFDVKLTLDELLVNGVLHGNESNPGKSIDLKVDINNDKIIIKVEDEGLGFVYRKRKPVTTFAETGRGLMLVDGICDSFSVNNNIVTCIFSRNKN